MRSILSTLTLMVLALAGPAMAQTTTQVETPRPAVVIQLEGEINDYTRDDLMRRFREARDMGAKAIILEIDSYGGLVTSGLETSRFIKQQDIPVYAFVKEKAISAGAMIALACNGIWMAPHTALGDAAPIMMSPQGGLQEMGAAERAKAESPVVEDFRDSARRNGYNTLLAEAMVVVGREVYYVQKDGEKRFVDAERYEQLKKEGGWEPVIPDRNPIDSKESLLTVHSDIAVQLGLAKAIATSTSEVARLANVQIIATLDRTVGDRLIALLSSMGVRALLIIALIIAIFLAVKTPGMGFPEAGIVVCLALLLGIPAMTGYAQWWEIAVVLLGVILLAVEIFVIPGFGLVGITGILCILAGLIGTFVPKELPDSPGFLPSLQGTQQALEQGFLTVIVSLVVSLVACYFIARALPRMPLFNKLILTTTVGGGRGDDTAVAEAPDAVAAMAWVKAGDEGQTLTDLRPGGTAQFQDPALGGKRNVDVICDSGFIAAGTKVIVHELQGSTVVVRRA